MSQILDELREIITASEIPVEDQNDLLVFLPILPEETIENLVKVFTESPEKIEEFNTNFKSKVKAITGGNDEEWGKIIEEEEGLGDDALEADEEEEVAMDEDVEKE